MNILVVIKLFFIMGRHICLICKDNNDFIKGIPWTLDVISAAVTHNYGTERTFEVRVALDVLNLLTVRTVNSTDSLSISIFGGDGKMSSLAEDKNFGPPPLDNISVTFLTHTNFYLFLSTF